MQTRYHKLAHLMEKRNLDAVLVSDGYNMRYLSGFTGATGYLLITKNSKTLFTDSRYTVAAMAQAPDYTVVEVDAARDYLKAHQEELLHSLNYKLFMSFTIC